MKKKICMIAFFVLIIDQFIKGMIFTNISYGQNMFILPNFFYLTYVKNTGGAWSIFDGSPWLLILIGIISLIALSYYIIKKTSYHTLEIIYLGLIIGGVIGNFLDRLFHNGVIDYIGFQFGSYYFPIFNIADICIVCGVVLIIIDSVRSEQNGIRSNKR